MGAIAPAREWMMLSTPVDQPDETPIWRYMDLAKFVSLVLSRKLWFPKLSELWRADPWEGFGRAKGLQRPSRALSKLVSLQIQPVQALYAEFSGLAAQTVRSADKRVYANSWCMGGESLSMWERYGDAAGGVAIQSTVGRFKSALRRGVRVEQYAFGAVTYHASMSKARDVRHDFTAGPVPASANLWRLALKLGFNKRTFYEDEKEWRAAIFQEQLRPGDRGLLLPVALDVLIQTVRVGPRADQPTVSAVKEVMPCAALKIPLEESSILTRPRVRRSR
jgi:hypothetical protein